MYLSVYATFAPQLEFMTVDGQRIWTSDLRGKVVLVNFWATSCAVCVHEMPAIVDTHRKFEAQGFDTIAVAMQYDPPNYVAHFTAQRALPFKVALDPAGELAKGFGNVVLTPTTFILDKRGKIIKRYVGEPDFTELHTLIASELKVPG